MSVLVSGANGFIATHIVDNLLEAGYPVIGTVRSATKAEPLVRDFLKKYPAAKLSIEVVEDITAEGAFDGVLQNHHDVKYVLHTASPATLGLDKPLKEAYLDPALAGTLSILKSIKTHAPQVTNVVITSSFAAIYGFNKDYVTYTNEHWSPLEWEQVNNEVLAYCASKKYAEKAAWEFVEQEKPNFKLSTICPPYVFGPQLFDWMAAKKLNTSNELITKVINTPQTTDFLEKPSGIFVDVRDVAKIHKLALEKEASYGTRLFIGSQTFTGQTILNILNKNFPEKKLAVGAPEKDDPNKVLGFNIENVLESIGGYKFISLERSVVDTASQYWQMNS
ncbi:hypothetical protein KL912_004572 [Ogataea haglerorum]|nr:hypothetical protein KL951_001063 [Ogataea haglerorum]KAG7746312.1 hypothetical protein KL912_004572 [Ogataea haglerorum]KAG7785163.1 hypothetical protein KL945_003928 [Ogataea haglerorum]KAG7785631.1 hypothetical protein KL910_004543 [Ogataea haglerorum]KAG7803686.1 hypothetical protein KL944_001639 [Ogataea haglerorum]